VHYEQDNYTNYSHDASVDDHVFAAEVSELDALKERFATAFASGTEYRSS
jgi:hypothetical protein